jgi:hypothetical protein
MKQKIAICENEIEILCHGTQKKLVLDLYRKVARLTLNNI